MSKTWILLNFCGEIVGFSNEITDALGPGLLNVESAVDGNISKLKRCSELLCCSLLVEAVRRNKAFANTMDVEIRLRCAAFFTNARDRKTKTTHAPPENPPSDSE